MEHVVIVDAARLPIGKLKGSLSGVEADHMAARLLVHLLERSGMDGSEVDEVILGQAKQTADLSNVARVAALRAGLPTEVPAYTVHRQCGSGVQAVVNAAQQIALGHSKVILAGGTESMSTAPHYVTGMREGRAAGNFTLKDPNVCSQPGSQPIEVYGELIMGITAENIAEKYGISRREQDEFAMSSQEKWSSANASGKFKTELVPYELTDKKGTVWFDTDEHPRTTSIEKLGLLKPAFKKDGTVTAGNSSGRNDGAAALLLMSEGEAERRGLIPLARVVSYASAGVDPAFMGLGPIPATEKALRQCGLTADDMDVIELNEAFAAQALQCIKFLGLNDGRVNPNGGAIAMGHPIGATGAILVTKLAHELRRREGRYGLATLCIAGGMGISLVIENYR